MRKGPARPCSTRCASSAIVCTVFPSPISSASIPLMPFSYWIWNTRNESAYKFGVQQNNINLLSSTRSLAPDTRASLLLRWEWVGEQTPPRRWQTLAWKLLARRKAVRDFHCEIWRLLHQLGCSYLYASSSFSVHSILPEMRVSVAVMHITGTPYIARKLQLESARKYLCFQFSFTKFLFLFSRLLIGDPLV